VAQQLVVKNVFLYSWFTIAVCWLQQQRQLSNITQILLRIFLVFVGQFRKNVLFILDALHVLFQ
jgi:hypothetical protein